MAHQPNIIIPGDPPSLERPRFSFGGRGGTRPRVYNILRNRMNETRQALQDILHQRDPNAQFPLRPAGPVVMTITFCSVRPVSHYRNSRRIQGNVRPAMMNAIPRKDLDNMVKYILDAMQGVLYRNDNQVVTLNVHKQYDDGGTLDGKTVIVLH